MKNRSQTEQSSANQSSPNLNSSTMSQRVRSYNGHTPELGQRVWIDPSAVVIGQVHIAADSSVWPLASVRGDMTHIHIGERTTIQDGAILHSTHASSFNPGGFPLTIGDDVSVAHQAMLHGCTVGDRVLIGMQTIIMDGAKVGSDVIIGAGSLVPPGKVLESGYLYVGRPVQQKRPLNQKELDFFTYVAGNYVKVKDQYIADEEKHADTQDAIAHRQMQQAQQ